MDDKSIDNKELANGCMSWLIIFAIFLIIIVNVIAHSLSGGC